jgi:hypothetical protein
VDCICHVCTYRVYLAYTCGISRYIMQRIKENKKEVNVYAQRYFNGALYVIKVYITFNSLYYVHVKDYKYVCGVPTIIKRTCFKCTTINRVKYVNNVHIKKNDKIKL